LTTPFVTDGYDCVAYSAAVLFSLNLRINLHFLLLVLNGLQLVLTDIRHPLRLDSFHSAALLSNPHFFVYLM